MGRSRGLGKECNVTSKSPPNQKGQGSQRQGSRRWELPDAGGVGQRNQRVFIGGVISRYDTAGHGQCAHQLNSEQMAAEPCVPCGSPVPSFTPGGVKIVLPEDRA